MVYLEKGSIRLVIDGKNSGFQLPEQLLDSGLLNGFCLGAFLPRLLDLILLDRMYMRGKVVGTKIPEPVDEIIESTDTRSITEFEPTEDGIEGIDFQLRSPVSEGRHLEANGQQVGTLHAGGSPWLRAKDGILRTQEFIGIGQVEVPEAVDDVPGGTRDGVWIRIIFTEICSNKILVGGMAAGINR